MSKFDEALARMSAALTVPASKNEGSFSMFNLRAVAQEAALIRNGMEMINDNWSLDSATGTYLDAKADDYGMWRKTETYARGDVTFVGSDGLVVPAGTQISAPEYGVSFTTDDDVTLDGGTGSVGVTCTTLGSAGNVAAESVNTIDTKVEGLASVTNAVAFSGGVDMETDGQFRKRIYEKIRTPATSGNVAHYKEWATSVNGVGSVKVFPLWNGAGTVKVSILDANNAPATDELVEEVQNYIDPTGGTGEGMAPIGASVTVSTATAKAVNVVADVVLASGASLEAVKAEFTEALTEYFKGLAYDGKTTGVSVARVGYVLLDVSGVSDYDELTISGGDHVSIGEEEVLTVGEVTLT